MTDPIKEIEDAIPDERKNLSFGDPDQDIIDVMDEAEKEQHHRGEHMDDELETCPFCPDPEGEKVRPHSDG